MNFYLWKHSFVKFDLLNPIYSKMKMHTQREQQRSMFYIDCLFSATCSSLLMTIIKMEMTSSGHMSHVFVTKNVCYTTPKRRYDENVYIYCWMNINVERFCEWTNVAKRHILISSPIGQRLVTYTVVDNLIQNLLLNRKLKKKNFSKHKLLRRWIGEIRLSNILTVRLCI